MFVQVCGAARTVTGSCYLVEAGDGRFLVDCGMHQGGNREETLNFEPFPFAPDELDFVLLTHAHIDHSGRLPRLVKEGFSGPIYATSATCDLAEIMLLDSVHIQEMEAEWQTRKARRAGRRGADPLYTEADVRKIIELFRPIPYHTSKELRPGVTVQFYDAGHILGSAFIELCLEERGERSRVVFSGDIGQPDRPIIRDPEFLEQTDYLIMESTYGDRLHQHNGGAEEQLAAIVEEATQTNGNIIIPAFAVGRTQELIYVFRQIFEERGVEMPIYVDSPLASRATEVYRAHRNVFDEEAWKLIGEPGGIFDYSQLHYTAGVDESRGLNEKKGIIIISASGMAIAGRIRHHLKHNLWRPETNVVIVGFQAQGTLGRRLLEGAETVRLFGEEIAVKAKVHEVTGFSAHADQEQLLVWASHFAPPRLVIITHGEIKAATTLQRLLENKLRFRAAVADVNEIFDLTGAR